ncbi:FAD-binding oxidoreductase [Archaeoglobus neptunius]|uniref:FAD-binding oxidoreductase n=1 Tax=Archaeoglobus neptunius TaxID=2798580 RepID=UPI001926B834
MTDVYSELKGIVGENYVSKEPEELYIYSSDPGTMPPVMPDYVVMPGTTEEVQKIVILANRYRIPVVPMGGALSLSGLVRPLKGGIVVDMKRMDRIVEVNERARYAVIEAGVSEGKLKAYLKKNHPGLRLSTPDAPPIATVTANALIHGSGRLSQIYGFHSEMVNGMEVVLPTGDICRVGSCSISPYWFSRSPLPDLAGLFLGWFGRTGIVTKLGIKLFPKHRYRDVMIFVTENPSHVSDVIWRVTHTEMAEDITVWAQPKPDWAEGFQHTTIYITADSEEELEFKRKIIRNALKDYIKQKDGGFLYLTPGMKSAFLEEPMSQLVRFADVRKGGGFEYVGAILPVYLFDEAYRRGLEIVKRLGVDWAFSIRIIGRSHCMMFAYAYPFNRADEEDVERAKKALHETNKAVLEMGGIPWKAEEPAQQMILERMDEGTKMLMKRVIDLLDPNGIMNPGNWEVE